MGNIFFAGLFEKDLDVQAYIKKHGFCLTDKFLDYFLQFVEKNVYETEKIIKENLNEYSKN